MPAFSRNPCALAVVLLAASGLAGSARGAEALEGIWDTPLGRVRIEPTQGGYLGRLLENAPVCRFQRGDEVLRGKLVDDLFAGELRVCYPEACGAPRGWQLAMAARVEGGGRLVGAAAPSAPDCPNLVTAGKPFAFVRNAEAGTAGPERHGAEADGTKALISEAKALIAEGHWEAARRKLERAERLDGGDPEIPNLIGMTYYGRNDFQEAERYYRSALRRDPAYGDAHYNLGCVLARRGRPLLALAALRRAVEVGFAAAETMKDDRDLASIRAEPGYQEILRLARANAARSHERP